MKLLVASRADKNIAEMTNLTFPVMKRFCTKWGADFAVLDHEPPVMSDDNRPHFRITKIAELLNDYDRVLNLDSDLIINKTCPNPFDIIPEDCIGTIYEDVGSRQAHRQNLIQAVQQKFGDIGWKSGYINTGFFMVSRMHKEVFSPVNGSYWTGWGSDDVHIGYQIKKLGFKVHQLDHRFNHMTMFSEHGENRFDSFIIHYAGAGIFDAGVKSRNEQIAKDVAKISFED